jgi:hypothetical protein
MVGNTCDRVFGFDDRVDFDGCDSCDVRNCCDGYESFDGGDGFRWLWLLC